MGENFSIFPLIRRTNFWDIFAKFPHGSYQIFIFWLKFFFFIWNYQIKSYFFSIVSKKRPKFCVSYSVFKNVSHALETVSISLFKEPNSRIEVFSCTKLIRIHLQNFQSKFSSQFLISNYIWASKFCLSTNL